MEPTRLFYLVNELGDFSVNRLILSLIKRLGRERYEFHIGYLMQVDDAMEVHFQRAGVNVINFDMSGNFDLKVISRLVRYLNINDIQIVHTHVLRPDLVGGLAARLARYPLLFSTKHNMGYIRGQKGWLLRNIFYWPIMYLPDQVITVSNTLRSQVISRLRLNPNRVITIHPGIDIEEFYRPDARHACRQDLGIGLGDFVVTYTGRLVLGKGLNWLLVAAHQVLLRHPNTYFLIVGDGPIREDLKNLAHELGIASKVIFTGFRDDIPEILAATDIFVLPSYTEGLPKSLLEAMAAGKAVVATQLDGILELIEPGLTGLIVPQRNMEALAEAVCELLNNKHQREEIGQQARSYVRLNFSVNRMVSAYDALYETHLTRNKLC